MENDISCIIWKGKKKLFGGKNYEEMSVWVIQVLVEQVNCISPWYVYTHSQIKSVLRERPVIQGKWRTGGGEERTHRGRKL